LLHVVVEVAGTQSWQGFAGFTARGVKNAPPM
jgi:hypothetical protein